LVELYSIPVNITSTDQTDVVLESVCGAVSLADDYVYYFGIYLVKKEENGDNASKSSHYQ